MSTWKYSAFSYGSCVTLSIRIVRSCTASAAMPPFLSSHQHWVDVRTGESWSPARLRSKCDLHVEMKLSASSSLKKFAGAKAPKQPGFYSALVDGVFAKTLMLQFHRSVSADAMVSALDEAMAKRLPAATVTKFRAAMVKALGDGNIAKGAHLYFMCKASTLLIGSGTPKIDAMLKEKGVCAALFDVYYGKSPVSVPAKENAAVGFAKRGFYA